ncbi:MAG TPA: CPBP family intramembrane glutamic endopeptidase [Chitinophagales bacterium]|nr:CPBP family intramembrane glutamic endopeptidase [Chitinophagales bacterium]
MRPPFRDFPFGIKLFLMVCLWLFNYGVVGYVAIMAVPALFGIDQPMTVLQGTLDTDNAVNAFLFVQGVSSVGGFFLSAVMFAGLETGAIYERLRMNHGVPVKMLVLAVFAIFAAQFFIEFLVDVMNAIPLPSSMAFLKDHQKETDALTETILNNNRFVRFIWVSVVFAVIPAVCEEIFFRGLLLGGFLRAGISPVVSIIVTGLIFSLTHWEYQNTLAIWALGAFLGYAYYISGSLWLSVALHFTNNFMQVLFKYLYATGNIKTDVAEASMPWYATLAAIIVFAGCLYVLNRWKKPYEEEFVEEENTAINF